MNYTIIFLPEAAQQIEGIEDYVAERGSADLARKFIDRLVARCGALSHAPRTGSPRDDLAPGLRTIAFERAVTIIYRVGDQTVEITGLMYRGRDITGDFG